MGWGGKSISTQMVEDPSSHHLTVHIISICFPCIVISHISSCLLKLRDILDQQANISSLQIWRHLGNVRNANFSTADPTINPKTLLSVSFSWPIIFRKSFWFFFPAEFIIFSLVPLLHSTLRMNLKSINSLLEKPSHPSCFYTSLSFSQEFL